MSTDSWRLHYTYLIGAGVLVGVWIMLFIPTPDISGSEKLNFAIFVTGIVLGFIFNRESSVSASRQTERAVAQGANAGLTPPAPPTP